MPYQVILFPAKGISSALSKVLLKILGPGQEKMVDLLISRGGVVLEHPDKEAAAQVADQLRELGALVEVREMNTDGSDDESSNYRISLIDAGKNEQAVVKIINKITGLGLKNSKELVDRLGVVAEKLTRREAEKIKMTLEALGAKVKMEIDASQNPKPAPKPDAEDPIQEGTETDFVVYGTISQADGTPVTGITVRAIDRDLRSKQLLGESVTDTSGNFKITYTAAHFKNAEKDQADLLIRAYNAVAELLSESALHFNVQRQQEINLSLPLGAVVSPSDYEVLVHTLKPLLDGVELSELTAEDISFLANETGTPSEEISLLAEAVALAKKTGVASAVFWGMGMQDSRVVKFKKQAPIGKTKYKRTQLPDLTSIIEAPLEEQMELVSGAIQKNRIPAILNAELDAIKRAFSKFRAAMD